MITAAINDNSYNIVLLLHLISIILGTGAVFVTPVLIAKERQKLISPAICEQVMGQPDISIPVTRRGLWRSARRYVE